LRKLGVVAIATADAAAALGQSAFAASKTLARLAQAGLVVRVRKGMWWIDAELEPYVLAGHLTAPLPAHISLQTALQLRGLIEQIPEVVYVVSLARTENIATTAGNFSIHHIAPELFGGFDETPLGVRLATPEKALFDVAYLSAGRSRRFVALPGLEVPRGFRWKELELWRDRIPTHRLRVVVTRRLRRFLEKANLTALPPPWLRLENGRDE